LAETDCDRKVKTRTNVLFGRAEVAFGEDECAAAQTVHFNASVGLEWWCATNATADQNVSNTQKTAMCLTIDRINGTQNHVIKLYTENANEHNRSINPTTAETDEGSSTGVTVARGDSDGLSITPHHCAARHPASRPSARPVAARQARPHPPARSPRFLPVRIARILKREHAPAPKDTRQLFTNR